MLRAIPPDVARVRDINDAILALSNYQQDLRQLTDPDKYKIDASKDIHDKFMAFVDTPEADLQTFITEKLQKPSVAIKALHDAIEVTWPSDLPQSSVRRQLANRVKALESIYKENFVFDQMHQLTQAILLLSEYQRALNRQNDSESDLSKFKAALIYEKLHDFFVLTHAEEPDFSTFNATLEKSIVVIEEMEKLDETLRTLNEEDDKDIYPKQGRNTNLCWRQLKKSLPARTNFSSLSQLITRRIA